MRIRILNILFQTKEDDREGAYNTRVVRNTCTIFTGRPDGGKGAGVRPKRRLERNTGIVLKEMGCDDGDQVHFAQDRDQW
jgi:hypothetical protein